MNFHIQLQFDAEFLHGHPLTTCVGDVPVLTSPSSFSMKRPTTQSTNLAAKSLTIIFTKV